MDFFNTKDVEAAFTELRSWNTNAAYLYTRGAEGATLHIGEQTWHARPPSIAVVDSVGAGDASMGGLIYSLMAHSREDWDFHLRFSVAAGAGACLAAGAIPPDLETIEQLLKG